MVELETEKIDKLHLNEDKKQILTKERTHLKLFLLPLTKKLEKVKKIYSILV